MKILVIGQGGREHALIKAFARSPSVSGIHAIPGNDGMIREALCHPLDWRDTESLINFCLRTEIDYVFVGPEDPLVDGVAERLRDRGILVVGPNKAAAQLEGSKIFAKNFMKEAGIPTATATVVDSVASVKEQMGKFTPPYVLKADGLAAGKGVFICKTEADLLKHAKEIFEDRILGDSGARALLEQFTPGWEMSYLVLTNGHQSQALPVAQDHKRLQDGDEGPNTGGMGTVAPLNVDPALRERIENEIVQPTIRLLEAKGLIYRGVLFIGLMITPAGPIVIEYNVRFGDPETQVILPLVDGDLGQIFHQLSRGELLPIRSKSLHSACVVMAAEGYPQSAVKGSVIEGDLLDESASSYFIHAGTKKDHEGKWVTYGGRVLGAVGLGSTREEALVQAYLQAEKVRWKGLQKRWDIGKSTSST